MIWSTRPAIQSRYSPPVRTSAVGKPASAGLTSAFASATAVSPSSPDRDQEAERVARRRDREELVGVDDHALQDRRIAVAAHCAEAGRAAGRRLDAERVADGDPVLLAELLLDERIRGAERARRRPPRRATRSRRPVGQAAGSTPLSTSVVAFAGRPFDLDAIDVLRRARVDLRDVRDPRRGTGRQRRHRVARDDQLAAEAVLDTAVDGVLQPCAKTATNTTSPSPTMSAAAVTAVRPGLRDAFSRASSPVVSCRRCERPADQRGQRPHDVARARRDADEDEQRAGAHRAQACGRGAAAEQALEHQCEAGERDEDRGDAAQPREPWAVGGASSRIAATGETRVARTAGMIAATSVTPMPTESATTIVRGARSIAPRGMPMPAASKSAPRPRAKPRPRKRPATEAATPIGQRLRRHGAEHLAARGAEGAHQRELARALRDRDREGVEDDEGADEQRRAGEGQQRRGQEAADLRVDLCRVVGGGLRAGLDLEVLAEHVAQPGDELVRA